MANISLDTLTNMFADDVTSNWHEGGVRFFREPTFVIYSADTLHQNTIDDSNFETLSEYFADEFPEQVSFRHDLYVSYLYVPLGVLEDNDELRQAVYEVMETLVDYAIWDESHYHGLENQRMRDYVWETLYDDMVIQAFNRKDNDKAWDTLQVEVGAWLNDNLALVWEYNAGSVDDYPFDTDSLTIEFLKDTR